MFDQKDKLETLIREAEERNSHQRLILSQEMNKLEEQLVNHSAKLQDHTDELTSMQGKVEINSKDVFENKMKVWEMLSSILNKDIYEKEIMAMKDKSTRALF